MAELEPTGGVAVLPRDCLLVERVQAGEEAAFRELFRQYRRLVYSLGLRLLNDPEEADDLCQEVFLVVHRRIASLRDPSRLRAWICRIAVTRAQNIERSFRRRFRYLTVSLDSWAQRGGQVYTSHGNPELELQSAETRRRIDNALASLAFPFRSVVVLRDLEGLSYDEIAEALGISLGTVKSRLARGRESLRESLRDLLPAERRP